MKKVSPHIDPRVLNEEQKKTHVGVCQDWLEAEARDDIFSPVTTGDESWVYEYDLVKKRLSMVWLRPDEPRVKKACRIKSKIKALVTVFFDYRGIILIEWALKGQTVKGVDYVETLKWLRERVPGKRPDLWTANNWIAHFGNTGPHRAFVVRDFLSKNKMTTIEQPLYSPVLSPCEFFLFDKIKDALRGNHLSMIENIKAETTRVLKAIPEKDFQKCFANWKNRMNRCISAEGEYFEGDKCYNA